MPILSKNAFTTLLRSQADAKFITTMEAISGKFPSKAAAVGCFVTVLLF
jgi:hypothetical protein